MPDSTPAVVTRYLEAADKRDSTALADCFTPDGTVLDEGHTYTGREQIAGWREALAAKFTYTSTVTASMPVNEHEYRVGARVEGDFPGGVADLTFDFVLAGDLIGHLKIGA